MAYRLLVLGVTLFWAFMTFLLIRGEMLPSSVAPWLKVPPEHVVHELFRRGELSELRILHNGLPVGTLRIQPVQASADRPRHIRYSGDGTFRPSDSARQRVLYDGRFLLGENNELLGIDLRVQFSEPAMRFEIHASSGGDIRYSVKDAGGMVISEQQGTAQELLEGMPGLPAGIDFKRLAGKVPENALVARRASLRLRNESVEVYRLILPYANTLQTEIDVSHLGKILRIKTFFGYDLLGEGLDL